MITATKLAEFAKKNEWIVLESEQAGKDNLDEGYIRYLTPAGRKVFVAFYQDGSIQRIV